MYSFICILLTVLSTSLFAQATNPAEQQTLSIIKPDAVAAKHIGPILSRFEEQGLRIAALKMTKLTKEQAGQFYAIHKNRPFYHDLVEFMSTGPVVVLVLKGEEAVAKTRALMGATDPAKAEKNTIRAEFAQSVTKNAVHGSDSVENAQKKISFFFSPSNIY